MSPRLALEKTHGNASSAPASSSPDEDWVQRARCRDLDTEIFFSGPSKDALKLCAGCMVRWQCLTENLRIAHQPHRQDGVNGGMTEGSRKTLIRVVRGLFALTNSNEPAALDATWLAAEPGSQEPTAIFAPIGLKPEKVELVDEEDGLVSIIRKSNAGNTLVQVSAQVLIPNRVASTIKAKQGCK